MSKTMNVTMLMVRKRKFVFSHASKTCRHIAQASSTIALINHYGCSEDLGFDLDRWQVGILFELILP